ncbi:MAG: beta-galactosidase [Thiolinea sp.]
MKKPELGVCYYPEHWPQEQWQTDAAQMVATGITWVRIGEFAWSRIEPKPGEFKWNWLDTAIEVLSAAGLKIVLGTPTATPPRWLLTKHPDMLAVDSNNHPRGFGSRRHYDFSHLPYRREAARISGLMAERYGHHSGIMFWQTDNEYGCHDTTVSYSAAALAGFQHWLSAKYGGIDALNTAWGNVFWSMEYSSFSDIELPNLTVTEANPAHCHDFRRYSSDQVVAFNTAQTEAIREYDTDTPILHNYMGRITDFDHFAVGEDLEAASWDSYPLGFLEDRSEEGDDWKRQFMRQGDPDFQAFHHDLYRAVGKGRWWVMEQQPGPVNWAPYNPAPLDGMVRLWAWEAIAHGAEVVSFFRWRQAPFAQEQMHAGLLRPDGQPAPALNEVQQLASELNDYTVGDSTAPVAMIFDYESAWAWETQPQGQDFSYFRLVFEQYRALRRLGLSVNICPPEQNDFSAYQLVLVPGLMHWKPGLKQALENVSAQILIGPRTGSKTADFNIPPQLAPDCTELIDVKVTHVESLRPDVGISLCTNKGGKAQHWREYLEVGEQTDVLFTTEDNQALLVQSGTYYYLGAQLDAKAYQQVMRHICIEAGLTITELPEGLRLRICGEQVFAFNYAAHAVDLSLLTGQYHFPVSELTAAGMTRGTAIS